MPQDTHACAHSFSVPTAHVPGCAPVIQVRAAGDGEIELGKRGQRNGDEERRDVGMRGKRGRG